jgi:hypothetical protein
MLVKDGNVYAINSHKDKANISLISVNQARRIMASTNKFFFLLLGEGK